MTPADYARTSPRAATPSTPRTRTPLVLVGGAHSLQEKLIRRLALDRLRDLHDDGVTMDYIGRMYDVTGDRMAELEAELRRR